MLKIKDATIIPREDYDAIVALENEARALGYPELR
jgi:hypothetical protein